MDIAGPIVFFTLLSGVGAVGLGRYWMVCYRRGYYWDPRFGRSDRVTEPIDFWIDMSRSWGQLHGWPELGYARLPERGRGALRGLLNHPVERDLHFLPARTIRAYFDEATSAGGIPA